MTLKDIWRTRGDCRLVAYRPGKQYYIPLGYKSLDDALENVASEQGLTEIELKADDWEIGEIVPHEDDRTESQLKAGVARSKLVGTVKEFKKR